jgi:hypothetical protein
MSDLDLATPEEIEALFESGGGEALVRSRIVALRLTLHDLAIITRLVGYAAEALPDVLEVQGVSQRLSEIVAADITKVIRTQQQAKTN